MEPVSFTQNCGVPDNSSGFHRPQANRSLGAHSPVSTGPAMLREKGTAHMLGRKSQAMFDWRGRQTLSTAQIFKPRDGKGRVPTVLMGTISGIGAPGLFYGSMKICVLFCLVLMCFSRDSALTLHTMLRGKVLTLSGTWSLVPKMPCPSLPAPSLTGSIPAVPLRHIWSLSYPDTCPPSP